MSLPSIEMNHEWIVVLTDLAPICLRLGNLVLPLSPSEIHATRMLHGLLIGKHR